MRSFRNASQDAPIIAPVRARPDQKRTLSPSEAALQAIGGNAIPVHNPRSLPRTASVPRECLISPQPSEALSTLTERRTISTPDMIDRFPNPPSPEETAIQQHALQHEQGGTMDISSRRVRTPGRCEARQQPNACKASKPQKLMGRGSLSSSFIMRYERTKPTSDRRGRLDSSCLDNFGTISSVPNDADETTSNPADHAGVLERTRELSYSQALDDERNDSGDELQRIGQDSLFLLHGGDQRSQLRASRNYYTQSIPVPPFPTFGNPVGPFRAGTNPNVPNHKSVATGLPSVFETRSHHIPRNITDISRREQTNTERAHKSTSMKQARNMENHRDRTVRQACGNHMSVFTRIHDENAILTIDSTLIPVTVTSAALSQYQQFCKHGRPLARSAGPPLPINLDGPPPSTNSTHTNTHSRPANAGSLAQQGLLRGLTWRTRMSRVKCWRCEMESTGQKGLGLVKEMLAWTCFCRFKGYELESDSETEREEEMHRRQAENAGLRPPSRG
nr:hypothetical protein CFP56_37253 [Quercus suber]